MNPSKITRIMLGQRAEDHAADTTRLDFTHHFDGLRSPEQTAYFLAQLSERLAALLDADRGQP
jgi:hypothetical protein